MSVDLEVLSSSVGLLIRQLNFLLRLSLFINTLALGPVSRIRTIRKLED